MQDEQRRNKCISWIMSLTVDKVMNSMVIHPKENKFYSFWIYYISLISLIQSFIYSILIAYDFEVDTWSHEIVVTILIIVEITYVIELFI